MMRSIACQSFGVQIVPLNPAVVVTVPGRSEIASNFPLMVRLDQGRSHVSQKLPSVRLSPFGFTVAPSRTVHHHIHPSSKVTHRRWLGFSSRSHKALKSCLAPWRAPNFILISCSILGKSGLNRSSLGMIFH